MRHWKEKGFVLWPHVANESGVTDLNESSPTSTSRKSGCFSEMLRNLEEIVGQDIQDSEPLKMKFGTLQGFQEKPKLMTDRLWIKGRRQRMRNDWAKVKTKIKKTVETTFGP